MSESETPQIRDIPKFKEMRQTMQMFKVVKAIFPFANPFLRLFGIETKEIKEALEQIPELQKDMEEITETPDKFNDIFISRGFIVFNNLSSVVVEEALNLSETSVDEAEELLVNHFTPEMVETYLYMMHGVKAFRPRMELAEKALIDYKEERYHACIPVILALMDGLVNELNRQQNRSFFSEDSDLKAWDCITAHEKGLNALKAVLHSGRYKTTIEEISIPYRNGILHGMDLGYANKTVAAKTWAALFAVRDWAIKAEAKQIEEPPPKPQTTWTELFQQINGHNEWKKSFEESFNNWKPRQLVIGQDVPINGKDEDYAIGTPERKLVEFLNFWQKKNYGKMANCISLDFYSFERKMAGKTRECYESSLLNDFKILEIADSFSHITDIKVWLEVTKNGNIKNKEVTFQVKVNETPDKVFLIRNMPNATWGIMNWTIGA